MKKRFIEAWGGGRTKRTEQREDGVYLRFRVRIARLQEDETRKKETDEERNEEEK